MFTAFPTTCSDRFKDSPFREDAVKRDRYLTYTAAHPSTLLSLPFTFLCISDGFTVKAKEIEVLAESVRTENHRKRALEAQKGYVDYIPPYIPASSHIKPLGDYRHLQLAMKSLVIFSNGTQRASTGIASLKRYDKLSILDLF